MVALSYDANFGTLGVAIPSGVVQSDGSTGPGKMLAVAIRNEDGSAADAADVAVSGTITAQNLVPAGVATAGSAIEINTSGRGTVVAQVSGVYTGALSVQGTVDGTTWVTLASASGIIRFDTSVLSATIASAAVGIFAFDATGMSKMRVTGLAAMTGTATVALRASVDPANLVIRAPLPPGTNAIGSLAAGGVIIGATYSNVAASGTTSAAAFLRYMLSSAATVNGNIILAGARRLISGQLINTTAALKYVKFYNKASAPTVGTDTPIITIALAANAIVSIADIIGVYGLAAPLGLGIAITGAWADADTTAVAAGDVLVNALYL